MTEEKIARINALAKKSRAEGLTDAEQKEQAALRREYIEAMKASLKRQLDNPIVIDPDGRSHRLRREKK